MKIYKNNKLGIKHVYFDKFKQRFRISLNVGLDGRSKHFGTFTSLEAAVKNLNMKIIIIYVSGLVMINL